MEKVYTSIGSIDISQEAILLIGIFIVVILLIFSINRLDKRFKYRIFLVCTVWWLILLFVFPPHGFNYNIYTYNAQLTLKNKVTFGRKDTTEIPFSEGWEKSVYFDYTAVQHLIYVGLTFINNLAGSGKLRGFGFQLWSYFTFAGVLFLIFYRDSLNTGNDIAQFLLPAVILTFHPVFSLYWLVYHWEDKLVFILVPLIVIYLIEKRKLSFVSFIVGFSIPWNGILIFFAPAFVIYLYRIDKKNFAKNLNLFLVAFIIAIIPFFPKSLSNWDNRLFRMDNVKPFWYSIYKLFPPGIYTPQLNKIITIALALIFNLMYIFKRICVVDMAVVSICLVIMLGPFNYIARFIPILFLITYLTPKVSQKDWLMFSVLMMLYFLINSSTRSDRTNFLQTLLFYIPFFYLSFIYISRRIKVPVPVLWKDTGS